MSMEQPKLSWFEQAKKSGDLSVDEKGRVRFRLTPPTVNNQVAVRARNDVEARVAQMFGMNVALPKQG